MFPRNPLAKNGDKIPTTPQELISLILGDVEKQLEGCRAGAPDWMALRNAHQHLYEAMFWISASVGAEGRIIRPS
jgi:hypothetical protein